MELQDLLGRLIHSPEIKEFFAQLARACSSCLLPALLLVRIVPLRVVKKIQKQ